MLQRFALRTLLRQGGPHSHREKEGWHKYAISGVTVGYSPCRKPARERLLFLISISRLSQGTNSGSYAKKISRPNQATRQTQRRPGQRRPGDRQKSGVAEEESW